MDVLVAYATKNGSTRQVAEFMTSAMQSHGARVTLVPLASAKRSRERLAGYDLIVLGAPLYSGRWHNDAGRFLRRHRNELADVPVAVFGMGPRDDTQEAWRRSREQFDKALARHAWLTPAMLRVFGGADPPSRSRHQKRRDLRDWPLIRAWAVTALDAARDAPPHDRSHQLPNQLSAQKPS